MGAGRRVAVRPQSNMLGVVHPMINIKVHDHLGWTKMFFRIKPSTPLKRLMSAYCRGHSVGLDDVMFLHDGRSLRFDITPDELGMEDGAEIDVLPRPGGGWCTRNARVVWAEGRVEM